MKAKKRIVLGLGMMLGIIGLSSCAYNDDLGEQNSSLKIRLTDAPGHYDEVWIDVQDVQIKMEESTDGEDGWESLEGVKKGMYNLVDLVNGKDTLLVDDIISSGTLSQIRLVLGDNNYIVQDSVQIDLNTPSAQQSGLKLNLHQEVLAGSTYVLILDFDAERSIVQAGNSGNYNLKPVIRVYADAVAATLNGTVLPDSVPTHVMAISNDDSIGTLTDGSGNYSISGLALGTYDMVFSPDTSSGFIPFDTSGVLVAEGTTTVDVQLKQQ